MIPLDTDDLGYARVDSDRERRLGLPEVVYGTGKTTEQIIGIVSRLLAANTGPVLVTRMSPEDAAPVARALPGSSYHRDARLLTWRPASPRGFRLCVVTAGTADERVAAEAAAVAVALGLTVSRIADVGVAGIHRVLGVAGELRDHDAVAVVAGMEGALASVIGGLVPCPVIAVPTSTGYGAALDGVTALLAMLTSCASGLVVVNIDSGFGAAMAAHRIAMAVEAE